MNNKYIWVFAENGGKTANNNSFYFWKHVVGIDDDIQKYFVLEKNETTKKIYCSLNKREKRFIVWKNSRKHFQIYNNADLLFATLSYRDVMPDKMLGRAFKAAFNKPLVYLQHGTLAMKKLNYDGHSYGNNMFRFCIYNEKIIEQFKAEHGFRDYQIYKMEYHPRYKELFRRDISITNKNQILWFLTWREYEENDKEIDSLVNNIRQIIVSEQLQKHLKENNLQLKICLHQLFGNQAIKKLRNATNAMNVKVVTPADVDVMDEIAKSEMLITDYSSLGFDFSILGKPVLMYQPDRETYLKNRELYCDVNEMREYSIDTADELVHTIVSGNYKMNEFFCSRLPGNESKEYIINGGHIDRAYNEFAQMQRNKVVFLGYNFHGIGGTVNATLALAEGLLEKGYMVEMMSLKKIKNQQEVPCGLNMQYCYYGKDKSRYHKLIKKIHSNEKNFGYLEHDEAKSRLIPYAGYAMSNYMRKVKARTVVSTRETLHFYVNDCIAPLVENKVYFFHTSANLVETISPGVIKEINNRNINNCIFVTEQNREDLKSICGLDSYQEYLVLGNSLASNRMITEDEISTVEKKALYKAIYLLRINSERKDDIENLIEFGKYLKANNLKGLQIDVYGSGTYVDEFIQKVKKNELQDVIIYCGMTGNPTEELKKHDLMIDFSLNNSFGMTYIEAVFNGKKVFCMRNEGSQEVMKDIPNSYIDSYEELYKKAMHVSEITLDELRSNYRMISKKYSRETVAEKFIKFVDITE